MPIIIGIVVLILVCLGSCGGGDNSSSNNDSTTPGTSIIQDDANTVCSRTTDNQGKVTSATVCIDKNDGTVTDVTEGPGDN